MTENVEGWMANITFSRPVTTMDVSRPVLPWQLYRQLYKGDGGVVVRGGGERLRGGGERGGMDGQHHLLPTRHYYGCE
jgi:hypothetical protein